LAVCDNNKSINFGGNERFTVAVIGTQKKNCLDHCIVTKDVC